MKANGKHISGTISSIIDIKAKPETIWEHITNVKIDQYRDPKLFRLIGIPKPLKAEIISTGVGGVRIASFNNGKKFIQRITSWDPYREYSFDFNPEKGFIVGRLFDLSDGVFRIPGGSYLLTKNESSTILQLFTTFSLDKSLFWLFNLPVRFILKSFQRHLLSSIQSNSELHEGNKIFRKDRNRL